MIAERQTFVGRRIQLDGASFKHCTFEHCQLYFSGQLGMELIDCTYGPGCTWHITGPAGEALNFLAGLYKMGATDLVEATFDIIRGKPVVGGPTIQ